MSSQRVDVKGVLGPFNQTVATNMKFLVAVMFSVWDILSCSFLAVFKLHVCIQ